MKQREERRDALRQQRADESGERLRHAVIACRRRKVISDHERAPDREVWSRHEHDKLKVPRVASKPHTYYCLSTTASQPPRIRLLYLAPQLQCHVTLKREKGVSLTLTNGHFGIRLLYAHDPRRRAIAHANGSA